MCSFFGRVLFILPSNQDYEFPFDGLKMGIDGSAKDLTKMVSTLPVRWFRLLAKFSLAHVMSLKALCLDKKHTKQPVELKPRHVSGPFLAIHQWPKTFFLYISVIDIMKHINIFVKNSLHFGPLFFYQMLAKSMRQNIPGLPTNSAACIHWRTDPAIVTTDESP